MMILLDTNFLMSAVQFKIGLEQLKEFGKELIILESALEELKEISARKGRDAINARVALEILKKQGIKVVAYDNENTDSATVKFAERHSRMTSGARQCTGCMVATNDRKLIKRLKNKGIKIIRLRQKKYLSIE